MGWGEVVLLRTGPEGTQEEVMAPCATMKGPCMMPITAMHAHTAPAPRRAAAGSASSEASSPMLLRVSTVLPPMPAQSGAAGIWVRM